jgi:predicted metal-dependent HD superfamily phosphohydrolase
VAEVLRARYAEPHRRYHGIAHLTAVLDHVDELTEPGDDADTIRLAAWFHDAVYDPERSDNEEISAQLAEGLLPAFKIEPDVVDEVARLVRLTASHDADPDDRNGSVLCDADLAILASGPGAYTDYAVGVRLEYAFLDDQTFARGRREVLHRLSERPSLFHTRKGRRLWESAARKNLATEIRLLDAMIGAG